MTTQLEQNISRLLRSILADLPDGAAIVDSADFREVLLGLEYFVPAVLKTIHHEWRRGGLDGVLPAAARKVRDGEVEIFGPCILITDQTVVPLHLRIQLDPNSDEISWLECRLGQRKNGGHKHNRRVRVRQTKVFHQMERRPYGSHPVGLYDLDRDVDRIDWVYKVTFGERRS